MVNTMTNIKAKTISLLLYGGDLEGVISIQDSSWNSGELYSAPRSSVADLLESEACNKYGVYMLLSKNMVYVGQSSDLARRINQHTIGKDWWTRVVILTTENDSLNRSDIDYLEHILIEKASKIDKLDCDNKNKGNPPKVDKFRKVVLQQYLEEALFLMHLIGITVFSDSKRTTAVSNNPADNSLNINTKLSLGKRVKKEAVEYLKSKGVEIGKNTTYAVKQERGEYWANPSTSSPETDWTIILNDTSKSNLTVLKIPQKTLHIESENVKGLKIRRDKPAIELKLEEKTLKDKVSGIEFKGFIYTTVKY